MLSAHHVRSGIAVGIEAPEGGGLVDAKVEPAVEIVEGRAAFVGGAMPCVGRHRLEGVRHGQLQYSEYSVTMCWIPCERERAESKT